VCVHEPHRLATLVADPEPFLRAAAAHVHDVLVDLQHVLALGLEELGVLEQGFHGGCAVPVHEIVVAQRDGAAEVFTDAHALAGVRPPDPVAVVLVQQAVRKALLSEVVDVGRSLEMHASALGRRVQAAYGLLARRPRLLVLAQAAGPLLGHGRHVLARAVKRSQIARRKHAASDFPYTMTHGFRVHLFAYSRTMKQVRPFSPSSVLTKPLLVFSEHRKRTVPRHQERRRNLAKHFVI